LRPPAAHTFLEQLHQPGHDQRQHRKHDQPGKNDIDLKTARSTDHHDAQSVLRAKKLRYHHAENGAADRKPQSDDYEWQSVRDHDKPRDVPLSSAERSNDIDQALIGIANAFVGVDQERKQRTEKNDRHFRP